MKIAKVAVLLDAKHAQRYWKNGLNVFESYIGEMLSHAGIAFEWAHESHEIDKGRFDVAIVALADESEATSESLWRFAQEGGIVISYGGLNAMKERLGCYEKRSLSIGYAKLADWNPDPEVSDLRFLQARPWYVSSKNREGIEAIGTLHADQPNSATSGAALHRFAVGSGWIDRWAVNIPYTVVGMQQGTGPVVEDGIPPLDQSANIQEGLLKADDRCEMDWVTDRAVTETGAPYFAYPYADIWRETAVSHLLKRVVETGYTLPFVGYWPEGVAAVAIISHDSDGNEEPNAQKMLEVLKDCRIQSTWCMIEPGYGERIYEQVKADGHELAFHYNALEWDGGWWDEREFERQLAHLKQTAGLAEVVSNKNHYTLFEGWGELFEWCERAGIACDQTRGPSKRGNVGFLFGTCHPYFPTAWSFERNRLYDVLELSFLSQDIDLPQLADFSIVRPLLKQVYRREGVAHFLFHQAHVTKEAVADALRGVVRESREMGFVFWTSRMINDWERTRRTFKVGAVQDDYRVSVEGDRRSDEAVVWIPIGDGSDAGGRRETKFGVPCVKGRRI
ncbi:hypothetical protein [Cohnella soli]|uniref:NodB homology domain-containing protein n=1 Tax=Cohnella soli TaxID=425005 RepID=A0ABW0I4W1_9BACL